ncbi:MAG TPA: hypothetical protein V6D17_23470, partial [Candidatus Obscuribacterales bacterium]
MDTREKLIKARLGLLALAEQLQNVRRACQTAGISRSHYYEIKQFNAGLDAMQRQAVDSTRKAATGFEGMIGQL